MKRPPTSGTRHGSGSWGGPAKGAGTGGAARKPRKPRNDGEPKAPPLPAGPGEGHTTPQGDARRAQEAIWSWKVRLMWAEIFENPKEPSAARIAAGQRMVETIEGHPVARQQQLGADGQPVDPAQIAAMSAVMIGLDDDDLRKLVEIYRRAGVKLPGE